MPDMWRIQYIVRCDVMVNCPNPSHPGQEMVKLDYPDDGETWESQYDLDIPMEYVDVYQCPIEGCKKVKAFKP